eukprot:GFUD01135433.1.p1 GENE.GFUD01135433.1~~GFUD01135433.1.p1  ORF type:complete len:423 (+),score=146.17 GFUD01135433.1:51-1271(+)
MESRLDHLYRSVLLTKFFTRGWGHPDHLQQIIKFRKLLGNRNTAKEYLNTPTNTITITKKETQDDVILLTGHFPSPVVPHLPHVCPPEIHQSHFQAVLPARPSPGPRPLVLQFAGTGDHFFWRRRSLMAVPMVKEKQVASILLENPYYGLRKPKAQLRSSLHHVSDLFVMGACLIMESQVLLKWAQKEGFGPLCCHGISMGGHMASLAASAWPGPIGLVPCLSWTSGSVTFCQGVMSKAINWKLLEEQFTKTREYKTDVWDLVDSPEFDAEKRYLNRHSSREDHSQSASPLTSSIPLLSKLARNTTVQAPNPEALHFMRGLMDECTHLGNYSTPVDTELVEIVLAEYDAYQPRQGVMPLQQLWPGARTRTIGEGHIRSYLLNQHVFRTAIYDVLERMVSKYPGDAV